jgi:hypothetical protein
MAEGVKDNRYRGYGTLKQMLHERKKRSAPDRERIDART